MTRIISFILLFLSALTSAAQAGYPINPVPFTAVHVAEQSFWGERLKASRETTIPLAFSKCEETGRYDNFVKALTPCDTVYVGGFSFDDTDVYKTIEGASYLLQTYPDAALDAYIDSVLTIVAAAQEPDGYLYTARQMNPWHPHEWSGAERWSAVEVLSHEFYNLGHMVDGAVAHYQATGKRNFLDIAIKYADCIIREIGEGEGQQVKVPGHQIAEMALARLYLATGEKKYLDQAKFFLDKRGYTSIHDIYTQSHKPILEQDEAVGHAVRAGYMYAGIADVAALTGEQDYIDAIGRIWENMVGKKLYITGGIGATAKGEAFGANYELPNLTAYCETCAAIGNVYTNYRLFLLHGDSKFYDVLERTLYNGLISGISIDDGRLFSHNPLAKNANYERKPWFGCACCPSNACRFVPSIPGYIYATKDDRIYINLYMPSEASVGALTLKQQTNYPWDGDITISVEQTPSDKACEQTIMLRVPGWVKGEAVPSDLYFYTDDKSLGYSVLVNGKRAKATSENGYVVLKRKWREGDTISLHFDMDARTVEANEAVEADRGLVAVERGPLVYCAEWCDNNSNVLEATLSSVPTFTLGNKTIIGKHNVQTLTTDNGLILIPYYAWAHRGEGNMTVWLKKE